MLPHLAQKKINFCFKQNKLLLSFVLISSVLFGLILFSSTWAFFPAETVIAQTDVQNVQTIAQTTDQTTNLTADQSATDQNLPDLKLTIFPATAYLMVKPGTQITHRIIVRYEGNAPVMITPELVDFRTDGLTGAPVLQKPSKLQFVTIQNPGIKLGSPFVLKPNEQQEIVLVLSPPLYAKLGEFPLSLILTAQTSDGIKPAGDNTKPDTENNQRNQTLNEVAGIKTKDEATGKVVSGGLASGGVASNVILSVQPDFENKGQLEIAKFGLPKFVDSFGEIKFEVVAKNVGRNGVAAAGEIELKHAWSGKQLRHWFIYPDVALAAATRQIRSLNQDPSEIDPQNTDQTIEFSPHAYKPLFLIGPYEVTVKLSSANTNSDNSSAGNKQIFHERTQRVIALPFSVVGLLLLGGFLYGGYTAWERKQ